MDEDVVTSPGAEVDTSESIGVELSAGAAFASATIGVD